MFDVDPTVIGYKKAMILEAFIAPLILLPYPPFLLPFLAYLLSCILFSF